jgi:hypothetical protein
MFLTRNNVKPKPRGLKLKLQILFINIKTMVSGAM